MTVFTRATRAASRLIEGSGLFACFRRLQITTRLGRLVRGANLSLLSHFGAWRCRVGIFMPPTWTESARFVSLGPTRGSRKRPACPGARSFAGRAAINYVDKVSTPTLFLHGEKDQTSSTNQSTVFFDALQERGVPTRFIKFPRQKHGIREPRLLRIKMVEEIRWMQKHVRGEDWSPTERTE